MMFSDSKILEEGSESVYFHLVSNELRIPLIICVGTVSSNFNEEKYPIVSMFVHKPYGVESLCQLVKGLTKEPLSQPSFISVKLPILLNFIGKSFDLYVKLSDTNYVKVVKQGEDFTREDSEKFLKKGGTHLHGMMMDSLELLKGYEENLNLLLTSKIGSNEDIVVQTIDILASVENVAKRLNWTPEAMEAAKNSIDTALRILSRDASLIGVLKKKLADSNSTYSRHVSLLSYMCCIFSQNMSWGGDSVQTKLAMAALLHDLAVEESYYEDIKTWNARASDVKDKLPETIKYRLHPIEAAKLVQSLKSLPLDVEQILSQHHEKKDGSGFPRGITSSRMGQLTIFFNMIEELVDFIGDGENLETSLVDFKMWGSSNYDSGQFKKTFDFIKQQLK